MTHFLSDTLDKPLRICESFSCKLHLHVTHLWTTTDQSVCTAVANTATGAGDFALRNAGARERSFSTGRGGIRRGWRSWRGARRTLTLAIHAGRLF
jgi:hypothetical protein